jgi:hypothetical protein
MLTLSQTATVTATGGQVTTEPIYLTLDANGKITITAIWFVDELSPSGLIYYGKVYSSNGCRIIPGLDNLSYSITGASFDLATAVQSGPASPSYSGAVMLTPTGNQTITTGNLTLTTGTYIETASAATGTGGLVRATSPTLVTPVLGVAVATSINKVALTQPATAATLTIANNKTLAASNSLTLAGTDGTTQTFQASDFIVGRATTDILSNKDLRNTGSGNSVTLLSTQGPTSALVGNSADQTVYTFTIPANTIQAGKGFRVKIVGFHSTGTASVTYKIIIGSTTTATVASTSGNTGNWSFSMYNVAGVQNSQYYEALAADGTTANMVNTFGNCAENFAQALAVKFTFNVANTDQYTGKLFAVELIQ